MSGNGHSRPAEIRARLDHPVIDADGHWLEFGPTASERLRKIGGDEAADGFLSVRRGVRESLSMSVAERRRRRIPQEAFWSSPSRNTRDRATGMLPRLLYERLEVLPEAFERVEDGLITAHDFRDFTFANAVRLWGAGNPGFFRGTTVEQAAAAVLAETRDRATTSPVA